MKHILLCTLLAVVAAATMECPGAVPEDASGKFWTQDNGGGDLGPLVQAHRGSRGEYQDNAAGGDEITPEILAAWELARKAGKH